jgi:hypothetical protein
VVMHIHQGAFGNGWHWRIFGGGRARG